MALRQRSKLLRLLMRHVGSARVSIDEVACFNPPRGLVMVGAQRQRIGPLRLTSCRWDSARRTGVVLKRQARKILTDLKRCREVVYPRTQHHCSWRAVLLLRTSRYRDCVGYRLERGRLRPWRRISSRQRINKDCIRRDWVRRNLYRRRSRSFIKSIDCDWHE